MVGFSQSKLSTLATNFVLGQLLCAIDLLFAKVIKLCFMLHFACQAFNHQPSCRLRQTYQSPSFIVDADNFSLCHHLCFFRFAVISIYLLQIGHNCNYSSRHLWCYSHPVALIGVNHLFAIQHCQTTSIPNQIRCLAVVNILCFNSFGQD